MAAPASAAGRVLEAKIVLIGNQGVGKTSMVQRYTNGEFSNTVTSTIGASFFTHKMSVEGVRVRLQIWDTAGQERFRSMAPIYFRGAHAALCIYDVTNRQSFSDLPYWVQELKDSTDGDLVLCIVGNKIDLESECVVDREEAETYAESVGALFKETSAKTDTHIQATFLAVVQEMLSNRGISNRNSDKERGVNISDADGKSEKWGCCS